MYNVRSQRMEAVGRTRHLHTIPASTRSTSHLNYYCHPHQLIRYTPKYSDVQGQAMMLRYCHYQMGNIPLSSKVGNRCQPLRMDTATQTRPCEPEGARNVENSDSDCMGLKEETLTKCTIVEDGITITEDEVFDGKDDEALAPHMMTVRPFEKEESRFVLPKKYSLSDVQDDPPAIKTEKRWSFCYGQDERSHIFWRKVNVSGLEKKRWLLHSWNKIVFPWRSHEDIWPKKVRFSL